jgi:hypothetical protein
MADRVASDHATIPTVDATIVSHGSTNRLAVELPAGSDLQAGDVSRLVVDGSVRFTQPQSFAGETVRITGAFDTPDAARSPGSGTNRLREWLDATALETGRTVHLDVIEAGFKYGVRAPGERVVYDAPDTPADSLASIASQLETDTEDSAD